MTKQEAIKLLKYYIKKVKHAGIPVEKAILFGSFAKGTAHKWSDIDACIVSPIFGKDRHTERLKLMRLTAGKDLVIEPHPYHPRDLKDKWDPLASEIRKHGISVT